MSDYQQGGRILPPTSLDDWRSMREQLRAPLDRAELVTLLRAALVAGIGADPQRAAELFPEDAA